MSIPSEQFRHEHEVYKAGIRAGFWAGVSLGAIVVTAVYWVIALIR